MRLTSVHIQNFRSFKDVTVPLNNYTCLVGPNGAGKSTVIAALDVFFRHVAASPMSVTELQREDFHQKDVTNPIKITLTFEDLSPDAQEDFKHYYRQGKLVVFAKAEWGDGAEKATVVQHGIRRGMAKFKPYFAKQREGAKAPELAACYADLRSEFPDLRNAKSGPEREAALREYEESHQELCQDIESHDEFYGATHGKGLLEKYIQWVHVPAVKDAAEEGLEARQTWLGQLLARAVRSKVKFDHDIADIRKDAQGKYASMLAKQQAALQELSMALSGRMTEWASPDAQLLLKWEGDPDSSVKIAAPYARVEAGDGSFSGALARQGHGFQRSYLVVLLQELATGAEGGPTLLLACEEPELYQHPPQARHLAAVFEKLSQKGAQVLVCTHSPLFVSGRAFEDIRMFRKRPGRVDSGIWHTSLAAVSKILTDAGLSGPRSVSGTRAKLHQALQPTENEMFFSPVLVLVEGLEDVAYITSHLALTDRIEEFRRLGCHIVPASKKSNMPRLQAVAKSLEIPTFVVFDSDAHETRPQQRGEHERDNAAILHLAGYTDKPPMPDDDAWLPNAVQWRTEIAQVVQSDLGAADLGAAKQAVRQQEGLDTEGGMGKNGLFIGLVLAELATKGQRSASLDRLCEAVLHFARSARSTTSGPLQKEDSPSSAPEPAGR